MKIRYQYLFVFMYRQLNILLRINDYLQAQVEYAKKNDFFGEKNEIIIPYPRDGIINSSILQ